MKWQTIIIATLLILPIAFSDYINDSVIRDSQSLTNITINETRYYDILTAEDTGGIYIAGYGLSLLGTEKVTFNITISDLNIIENATSRQLPYISASSATSKTLTQNVSDSWSMVVYIDSVCGIEGNIASYTCDTCTIDSYSCLPGDSAELHLSSVDRGNTVLSAVAYPHSARVTSVCGDLMDNIGSAGIWFGLIIIGFFAFILISIWQNGDIPDTMSIALFLMGLGVAAIILVVYLIMIAQMC